jgi:N-acetylated-alpha-linked acidic dipeptidase
MPAFVALCALVAIATPPDSGLEQWPEPARAAYTAYERSLLAIPARDSLLEFHQLIASEPHVAGTPGDRRNIERIAKAFGDMGLEVRVHEFWAYLSRPVSASLEIIGPEKLSLVTAEEPLAEDKFSSHPDRTFGWNAYSGSGDVSGSVVYANYGTKADFAKLAELGVDVQGKIVLARYGGNFRGYKAKFAELAGAAGVIIYTDPADSGYSKGIPYPEGGYSNSTCIERGSITTLGYSGDPLTPGIEATKDAPRLDPKTVDLPHIPVQPVSWAAAGEIMKRMTGPAVPAGWQGGLPFAYRTTGGRPAQGSSQGRTGTVRYTDGQHHRHAPRQCRARHQDRSGLPP